MQVLEMAWKIGLMGSSEERCSLLEQARLRAGAGWLGANVSRPSTTQPERRTQGARPSAKVVRVCHRNPRLEAARVLLLERLPAPG